MYNVFQVWDGIPLCRRRLACAGHGEFQLPMTAVLILFFPKSALFVFISVRSWALFCRESWYIVILNHGGAFVKALVALLRA